MVRRFIQSKDYIFSLIHGKEGADGCYQGLSQILDLPGNLGSVFSASISSSKWVLSFLAPRLSQGLVHCPDTWILSPRSSSSELDTVIQGLAGRPAIVKPNSLGHSLYVEFFDSLTPADLKNQIEVIQPYDNEILVQEYIKGVEYSSGVIERNGQILALPVAQILTPKHFFGVKEKENNLEKILFLTSSETEQIKLASLKLFAAIGATNRCRFDFICSDGKIYFLEANPIPGLGKDSILPKMLKEVNLSRLDLIDICISNSMYHKSKAS